MAHPVSKKARIAYFCVKLAVFSLLALFVFLFRKSNVENLKPFIGTLMLLYGAEGFLQEIFFHRMDFVKASKSYLAFVELVFGMVLILAPLQFEYVCIIWATWSIVRESYELKEIVTDFKTITPRVLSGLESVAVMVFSVLLIMNPVEHHAIIHMTLLVLELILSPLVILIDEAILHCKKKKEPQEDQRPEE